MNTNLNEALILLKLQGTSYHPNLNELLSELKIKEANYYRSKVVCISEAVLENPNNMTCQAQLRSSLERLDMLQSA